VNIVFPLWVFVTISMIDGPAGMAYKILVQMVRSKIWHSILFLPKTLSFMKLIYDG